jgi:hypothetical protein
MLARVQHFPTLTEDPSTQSIEVHFNSAAVPPASQFTFTSGERYLKVDEPTTISVTLAGGATFSSVPVIWQNSPPNGAPAVIMSSDWREISFLVPAPTHYFVPWVFALKVNFGPVKNITSLPFFLVRPLGDHPVFTLDYKAADGSFTFLRGDGQADIILAGQQILLNVIPDTCFTVALKEPRFNKIPIVWSNGQQPSWIKVTADLDNNSLEFSFGESAQGQFAGFQFAIDLPDDGLGREMTILSPDPILINATIGDG